MLLLDLTVQISDLCKCTDVKMSQNLLVAIHKKAQVDQA